MEQQDKKPWSSLELLAAVTAHMRANGVRYTRIVRGDLQLEVELDPAAQYLGDKEPEGSETPPEDPAEKLAKGLCSAQGCEHKGGHLGSAYCRDCFRKGMNGG